MLKGSAAVAGTIQIGEAAKLTALSIDAIRLYERRALLPKVPRTPGRFRLASLSVWTQPLRPWLLGASVVLLAVGFIQLHVRKSTCARGSAASLVIFWTAAVIVLLIILFPQIVASLIAR